jgi:hypothetical protein
VNVSDFHPHVNTIVFKQVVVLKLYSAFVLRSRSGFGALITGAEPYDKPVFAVHKNVFVSVVGLVFVGGAFIFIGRLWNKKRRKHALDSQDKLRQINLLVYKWQEKQEKADVRRSIQ